MLVRNVNNDICYLTLTAPQGQWKIAERCIISDLLLGKKAQQNKQKWM